jgi:response regulator of citrate/malate metabolism
MSTPDVHAATNGTVPASSDPLATIVAELEDLLAPLTAERQQLEARLKDLDTQSLKIREAIAALSTSARQPPQPKPKAKAKGRNSHDWIPSQKTLDDVYAVLTQSGEPMAVTAISDRAKTSRATATKAIEELRRRELVRFVGNGGRGGANLFAPMEK